MVTSAALQELQAFRSKLYGCCTRRRDALFELVEALLTADTIPSLAYLSLEPPIQLGPQRLELLQGSRGDHVPHHARTPHHRQIRRGQVAANAPVG